MLIWNKGKTTEKLNLDPERIEEIRKNNPDWFETTQSNGYYSLKLATNTKKEK